VYILGVCWCFGVLVDRRDRKTQFVLPGPLVTAQCTSQVSDKLRNELADSNPD
jgi:hypothetical protein